jgi:hypothetical protein
MVSTITCLKWPFNLVGTIEDAIAKGEKMLADVK